LSFTFLINPESLSECYDIDTVSIPISNPNIQMGDAFGSVIQISGSNALISAPNQTSNSGVVYVYHGFMGS